MEVRGKLDGQLRMAFMPQVSPDERHVVTMINDPGVKDDFQGRYVQACAMSPDGKYLVFVRAEAKEAALR